MSGYTTLAVGEEDPTTLALGEEEVTTTLATGEEEPITATTLAVGEETDGPSTRMYGEEGELVPGPDDASPFGSF